MVFRQTLENVYAIVIGIAGYKNINPLPLTVLNDAKDIYDLLKSPSHCGYPENNIRLLLDEAATKKDILDSLMDLREKANNDTTIIVYISSHGGRIETGPYAGEYLLPVDVDFRSQKTVAGTAISSQEFTRALQAIPARKVVVIFDCCHAGGIGQPKDANAPVMKTGFSDGYYDELKQGTGRVIIASSRSTEQSWILPLNAPNSLFTTHLLSGLRGGIPSNDGVIRIFDLFEYVQPRVTADQPNQHPIFKAEIEDNFAVALYCGGKKGVVAYDEEGFLYDAYISYVDQEPDGSWVWGTLVPRLEAAGLRVAVSGDVEVPGVARLLNIERGIQQAKRVVAVLSEAYLTDHMGDFENIMTQTRDVLDGTYRLLPIKIAPIDEGKLPLRMKMLTTLDVTNPRRSDREFERLLMALQAPYPNR